MNNTPSRVLATICATAAASTALALFPGGAAFAAADPACSAVAIAPVYSGGTVIASGEVNCLNPKKISMTVKLRMDGHDVASNSYTAVIATYGVYANTSAPNRSGDQEWCTVVSGMGAQATRCETDDF
ncbi:hypothetical protein [Micromonospora sp. NPDC001898]|uniref:hypothetical protein n=1 Tax=Micromonospora sp. NPDC001898 TaxID=3364221 RepID=UPI0036D0428C